MIVNKSNILLFSPQRCTGCTLCEMICSLQQTRDECNRKSSWLKVLTHPYLYSSVVSVFMDCDCPDGREKCVEICNQEAIIFVNRDESPTLLKKGDWLPSPVVSPSLEI